MSGQEIKESLGCTRTVHVSPGTEGVTEKLRAMNQSALRKFKEEPATVAAQPDTEMDTSSDCGTGSIAEGSALMFCVSPMRTLPAMTAGERVTMMCAGEADMSRLRTHRRTSTMHRPSLPKTGSRIPSAPKRRGRRKSTECQRCKSIE